MCNQPERKSPEPTTFDTADHKSGTVDHLHHKCEIQKYQNKNRLSVYRIHLLQQKPKLDRTKPSTGQPAGWT